MRDLFTKILEDDVNLKELDNLLNTKLSFFQQNLDEVCNLFVNYTYELDCVKNLLLNEDIYKIYKGHKLLLFILNFMNLYNQNRANNLSKSNNNTCNTSSICKKAEKSSKETLKRSKKDDSDNKDEAFQFFNKDKESQVKYIEDVTNSLLSSLKNNQDNTLILNCLYDSLYHLMTHLISLNLTNSPNYPDKGSKVSFDSDQPRPYKYNSTQRSILTNVFNVVSKLEDYQIKIRNFLLLLLLNGLVNTSSHTSTTSSSTNYSNELNKLLNLSDNFFSNFSFCSENCPNFNISTCENVLKNIFLLLYKLNKNDLNQYINNEVVGNLSKGNNLLVNFKLLSYLFKKLKLNFEAENKSKRGSDNVEYFNVYGVYNLVLNTIPKLFSTFDTNNVDGTLNYSFKLHNNKRKLDFIKFEDYDDEINQHTHNPDHELGLENDDPNYCLNDELLITIFDLLLKLVNLLNFDLMLLHSPKITEILNLLFRFEYVLVNHPQLLLKTLSSINCKCNLMSLIDTNKLSNLVLNKFQTEFKSNDKFDDILILYFYVLTETCVTLTSPESLELKTKELNDLILKLVDTYNDNNMDMDTYLKIFGYYLGVVSFLGLNSTTGSGKTNEHFDTLLNIFNFLNRFKINHQIVNQIKFILNSSI